MERIHRIVVTLALASFVSLLAVPAIAQESLELEVDPATADLSVGDELELSAVLRDSGGNPVEDAEYMFFSNAKGLNVTRDGHVAASAGGEFEVYAMARSGSRMTRTQVSIRVAWPPVESIELVGIPARMQSGNAYRVEPVIKVEGDLVRPDLVPTLRTSDADVLVIGPSGQLRAIGQGKAEITASAESVTRTWNVEVLETPVRRVHVSAERDRARTGDVIRIRAEAVDSEGQPVEDAPIAYSVQAFPIDTLIAPPATGQVDEDGWFVAEKPGAYAVYASSGGVTGVVDLEIEGRQVEEEVEVLGQGQVTDAHTSDLWVWEGVDGGDYAVTGTWGGPGKAYFWDVTDPTNIVKIDSIQVDARTVNDVKVSEDGRIAVISREGASNRRNGLVILDVSDPRNVTELSVYDDQLTGGVHNVFIYENHVYALSAGQRYDIISIEDPANPTRVGSFRLEAEGASVHDVWVEDGIAYSSNWSNGVVMVDVGNGIAGGSPSNPVMIGSYAYPSGGNHAAFPFRSQSTGKFYVIAGDEIMPECADPNRPCTTEGYLHFIDFTDPENPKEVARYQVPGAGTHNFWVEGDRLYSAFYNGGIHVIDISGELRGDLYRQGRQIAIYLAYDADGYVANTPMTWGPQPYKGNVFFAEFNSGLWAVKLTPKHLVP